jgi:hypothetical protein
MLGIILCFGSVHDVKAFNSGEDLLKFCEKKPNSTGDVGCHLYIKGLVEGFKQGELQRFMSMTGNYFASELCIPEGVTFNQLTLIVVKYLKNHPEKLHEHPSDVVLNSVREAFPCRN